MVDTADFTSVILESISTAYSIVYEVFEPYIVATFLGALGLFVIKKCIGRIIEFCTLGYSAHEIRKIKKSAFNVVDLLSAISDINSKEK